MAVGLTEANLKGIAETAINIFGSEKIDPAVTQAIALAVSAAIAQNDEQLAKDLSAKERWTE